MAKEMKSIGLKLPKEFVDKLDAKIDVIRQIEDRNVSYAEVVKEALSLWVEIPYRGESQNDI
jgi:Arc/MetJ-type ribon-helix-helix transcriptional regulator